MQIHVETSLDDFKVEIHLHTRGATLKSTSTPYQMMPDRCPLLIFPNQLFLHKHYLFCWGGCLFVCSILDSANFFPLLVCLIRSTYCCLQVHLHLGPISWLTETVCPVTAQSTLSGCLFNSNLINIMNCVSTQMKWHLCFLFTPSHPQIWYFNTLSLFSCSLHAWPHLLLSPRRSCLPDYGWFCSRNIQNALNRLLKTWWKDS